MLSTLSTMISANIDGLASNAYDLLLNAHPAVALLLAFLPALPSLRRRSAGGTLGGAGLGVAAASLLPTSGWSVLLWLLAWSVSGTISLRTERLRAQEQRHYGKITALARGGTML
jgi:hypothetical protein